MSTLDDLKNMLQTANAATPLTITVGSNTFTVTAGDLDLALGISLPAIDPPPANPPPSDTNSIMYATAALNVRSAPTTSGTILERIALGSGVTVVTGSTPVTADGHSWLSVQLADGTVGWCASDYLAAQPPPTVVNAPLDGPLFADLSSYNHNVTLAIGKANGIAGIMQKASQGVSYTDPTFAERKAEAGAAGLYFGAYHFGVGQSDPIAQAEFFMRVAAGVSVLVLDLENNPDTSGQTMTISQAEAFVQHVRQRTGRWPIIYTSPGFWNNGSSSVLAQCPLWVAAWGDAPLVPPPWSTWTLWQFTNGNSGAQPHTVTGIGTGDFDRFNGDQAALKAFFGG